jgi:hypothetical protein
MGTQAEKFGLSLLIFSLTNIFHQGCSRILYVYRSPKYGIIPMVDKTPIKYHWKEWLALESITNEIIGLECDEYFGFDGLDELIESIKGNYMKLDEPTAVSICKPIYFELDYRDFIDDFISHGCILTTDITEDCLYNHIGYYDDIEYSSDDAIGIENLQKAIDFFEAIHRPLLWLYKGWGIDNLDSFFPLSIVLKSAIKEFNLANRDKFVLYQPTRNSIELDDEYWALIDSGAETT